jgi:hypothetical protein
MINERIRELIEQATTEEHDGFRYFDKAKFAELIVKECASLIVDDDNAYDMLKHFGVEK